MQTEKRISSPPHPAQGSCLLFLLLAICFPTLTGLCVRWSIQENNFFREYEDVYFQVSLSRSSLRASCNWVLNMTPQSLLRDTVNTQLWISKLSFSSRVWISTYWFNALSFLNTSSSPKTWMLEKWHTLNVFSCFSVDGQVSRSKVLLSSILH